MKYENARKGLGKIFAGEVVSIIAAVIGIVAAVLMVVLGSAVKSGASKINTTDIISLVSMLVALVMAIVAFILNLVGIIGASKDDEGFKNALITLVMGVAASIVASVLETKHPSIAGYLSSLSEVCQLFVFYYVICGCMNIAQALKKDRLVSSCKTARVVIIVIWAISVVLNFLNNFYAKKPDAAGSVTLILALAGGIASIVSYIFYLSVIRRTIDVID